MKMTFMVLGILILSCNTTDKKSTNSINEISTDSLNNKENEHAKILNNQKLDDYKIDSINNVIALFKEKNIDKISSIISFPLYRQYPIPQIKDKKDFKKRFNEVFDQILINKIVNSKIEQWSEVGWRGIMLENGVLWMANSDGMITSINYQSDFEKKLRQDLITKDKQKLHISLRTFESPTYKIKTNNYLIRIDELTNYEYRYASWKIDEKESSKPSIILNNGELEFEGSGGNHVITFINGNYIYKVFRNIIGEEKSPDITIYIEKDGQNILTEDGTLIIE